MTFSLTGYDSIPTDGSGRVLITDIGNFDEDAFICRSERNDYTSYGGNWFLHPTEMSTATDDRIVTHNDRGWTRNRDDVAGHRLVRLRRVSPTAEEGVFTCDIPGDNNTPRYVGIYYPSES